LHTTTQAVRAKQHKAKVHDDNFSPERAPDRQVRTWRLVLAYHGGNFAGWQKQAGARTVQTTIEDALGPLAGEPVNVRGAGRTDAGVHARGQVASTTFASRVPPEKMILAANSQLPHDLAVVRAEEMPAGFDAKRQSVGKRYVYRVHTGLHHEPFIGSTTWHVRQRLDVEAMQRAAELFLGEQDFESFRSTHCDAVHARRYLWRSHVTVEADVVSYEVRGNAFCRHMVRCLAGTLVDVGRGRLRGDDVQQILEARDRTQAGVTAPAEGLTLEEVYYPDTAARAGIPSDARFPRWPVDDRWWPPRPTPASPDAGPQESR
jgi:tRNA pseudouridine38-40 synthase